MLVITRTLVVRRNPPKFQTIAILIFTLQTVSYLNLKSNLMVQKNLKQRLRKSLPYITLYTEMTKREFLIAPVLMELVDYCQAKPKISYPLEIEPQLKGFLDYFLQAKNNLLVIEAKDENLERGFKQLAVESIALAQGMKQSKIYFLRLFLLIKFCSFLY